MQRSLTANGRFLSHLLVLIILISVLSRLASPALAFERLEVVLPQGGEATVPLDIPSHELDNLVVKDMPAGVTAEVLQQEPGKESYNRLTASKDAEPGRYYFDIEDLNRDQLLPAFSK